MPPRNSVNATIFRGCVLAMFWGHSDLKFVPKAGGVLCYPPYDSTTPVPEYRDRFD